MAWQELYRKLTIGLNNSVIDEKHASIELHTRISWLSITSIMCFAFKHTVYLYSTCKEEGHILIFLIIYFFLRKKGTVDSQNPEKAVLDTNNITGKKRFRVG